MGDLSRLRKRRVWVVDPLDGTREFVACISEWCVSVALRAAGSASRNCRWSCVAARTVLGSDAEEIRVCVGLTLCPESFVDVTTQAGQLSEEPVEWR
jgi:fructose-1,6-bisphosphatase/inositol monophosphatase family enzyme